MGQVSTFFFDHRGYLAKGTKDLHHLNTDVITAISIPVIAGVVAWGTRRMRRKLAAEEGEAA